MQFNIPEALKTGVFACGSSGSGKTYLAFTLSDLLMKEGVTVYVFDPSQAWQQSNIPYTFWVKGDCNYPVGRQSCIYDISYLTFPQRQKFVNQFCKHVADRRKRGERWPLFLWFEEAHTYFPNGCMRSKKQNNAVELVTLGRNWGVRFGAITQFPSMVDKLLVKMTKQRYFGWTSEKNDVDYIEAMIGDKANTLRLLKTRQFIYDYPIRGGCTKEITTPMFAQLSQEEKMQLVKERQADQATQQIHTPMPPEPQTQTLGGGGETGTSKWSLLDLATIAFTVSFFAGFILSQVW